MSVARCFFNAKKGEKMGHKHSVYDSDTHFSINAITKVIKNESSKKTTLVQGDHNSERFTFDVPRFIEGHDMMLCDLIEVHYDNKETGTENVSSDYYEVKDKQISPEDGNMVMFSWLIIDTATKYAGSLEFSVVFKCMEDGVCTYKWGTTENTDISVSKRKDNSGVVAERQPNVVDQWRNEIFGKAENAVANINLAEQEAIAAVQAAGENIVNAASTAEQNAKNVLANAIKGKLSGEIVAADDVSVVEHEMAVKVKSKNMIPLPYHHENGITQQGVKITYDENGVITFNGTALADSAFRLINNASIRVKGRYTLSGCKGGSNTTYYLQPFIDGKGVGTLRDGSITYAWDGVLTSLAFFFKAGTVFENVQFRPQLEEGDTATEHTPYVAPESVTVRRCGKNLVSYPYSEGNRTRAGITYTIAEDGMIIYDGISTGSYISLSTYEDENLYLHEGVTYTLSGMPAGSSMATAYAHITESDGTTRHFVAEGKTTFKATSSGYAKMTLVVSDGTTVSNQKFKPMLEVGSVATDFEAYKGAEFTPNADGTVDGMTSLSPVMTILTDTEGVIVECEYNVDTKTYIDKKFAELQTLILGGN